MIESEFRKAGSGSKGSESEHAPTEPRIRVYELAKELGISHRDLLAQLRKIGIEIANHMSFLAAEEIDRLRKAQAAAEKHRLIAGASSVLLKEYKRIDRKIRGARPGEAGPAKNTLSGARATADADRPPKGRFASIEKLVTSQNLKQFVAAFISQNLADATVNSEDDEMLWAAAADAWSICNGSLDTLRSELISLKNELRGEE